MVSHFHTVKSKSLACFKTVYIVFSVTGFRTSQETRPRSSLSAVVVDGPQGAKAQSFFLTVLCQVFAKQQRSKGHIRLRTSRFIHGDSIRLPLLT